MRPLVFRTCNIVINGAPCGSTVCAEITTVCVHEHIEAATVCLKCLEDAREGKLWCTPCSLAGCEPCWVHLAEERLAVVAS